ncbi:MAG: GAF domain-containing protein, partial [Caldimonas sp.]
MKERESSKQPRARVASEIARALDEARDLAWRGRHEAAIDRCTLALHAAAGAPTALIELLDVRAESLIARARMNEAVADGARMLEIAAAQPLPAPQARAHNRQALLLMRRGQLQAALDTASTALRFARQSGQPRLLGESLLRLGEARIRVAEEGAAVAAGQRALASFETAGDAVGAGRAHWVISYAQSRLVQAEASRNAARCAATLARQTGDEFGLGSALNVESFSTMDIAERLRLLQQAAQAFERAGYLERRQVVMGNVAIAYGELGLYRRGLRLGDEMLESSRGLDDKANLAAGIGVLLGFEILAGNLESARARWPEYERLVDAIGLPSYRAMRDLDAAALAEAEGDSVAAVKLFSATLRSLGTSGPALESAVLVGLVRAELGAGHAAAALRASARVATLHKQRGYARPEGTRGQDIWWWHSRALAANGKLDAAWAALQQAHALLLDGVRNVRDEGLRRSYLSKVEVNRTIVRAWLHESALRKLPDAERLAHLGLGASLGEPFKRLVDIGTRLNELHRAEALPEFLIDEVTELSGAERVLLVLDEAGGPRIAAALLPRRESASALLQAVEPWLGEARRSRAVSLRHGPEGAAPVDQRSCLVAPLVVQGEVLGFLYADLDGAFGRFHEQDRDLMGMLAAQAAVALANMRWAEGLERKVAERTAELQASNARIEEALERQTATTEVLEVINASRADLAPVFDAITDRASRLCDSDYGGLWLVADSRARFSGGQHNVPPAFSDYLCALPDGVPPALLLGRDPAPGRYLHVPDILDLDGYREQVPFVVAMAEVGGIRTSLTVPLVDESASVIGVFTLVRTTVRPFTGAQIALVQSFAAQAQIAMKNARLMRETQESLEQQTASAEILQVIS